MSTLGIPPNRGAYVLTSYGIFEFIGRLLCSLFADNLSFSMAYAYAASTLVGGLSTMIAPTGKDLATMYAYSIGSMITMYTKLVVLIVLLLKYKPMPSTIIILFWKLQICLV